MSWKRKSVEAGRAIGNVWLNQLYFLKWQPENCLQFFGDLITHEVQNPLSSQSKRECSKMELEQRSMSLPTASIIPLPTSECQRSWWFILPFSLLKKKNKKHLLMFYIALKSILKELSPGCSLEGLMLKLKLQYFGHLMQRVDSLENTLMLGGLGGRRRRGRQRMRWLDGISDSVDVFG